MKCTGSSFSNESDEPIRPIWMREQYSTADPDLELTSSKVSSTEREAAPFDFLSGKKAWYVLIDSIDSTRIAYDKKEMKTRLRANILAGKHDKNSTAIILTKKKPLFLPRKDGWNLITNWNQKATSLKEFAKKHFAVGVIWDICAEQALSGCILTGLRKFV